MSNPTTNRSSVGYVENGESITAVDANILRTKTIPVSNIPALNIDTTAQRLLATDESRGIVLASPYLSAVLKKSNGDFNWSAVVDVQNDTTPYNFAADYIASDYIRSAAIIGNNWIIQVSSDVVNSERAGRIYYSSDEGVTWARASILDTNGNETAFHTSVGTFGWGAINGTEAAIVEYGGKHTLAQDYASRKVFYTNNSGQTWHQIYTPAALPLQHGHTVSFGLNTSTIYVSYGDGTPSLVKLVFSGEDKTIAANWTATTIAEMQPTAMYVFGNYLYIGKDGSDRWSMITRLNLQDDTLEASWAPSMRNDDATQAQTPYILNSTTMGNVFKIYSYNNVLYANVVGTRYMGGLYASLDGVNWVCVHRLITSSVVGEEGINYLLGYINGYLWGQYTRGDANTYYVFKMLPLNINNSTGTFTEPAATNTLTADQSDIFATSQGGWTMDASNNGSLSQDTSNGISGSTSLLFTGADGDDTRASGTQIKSVNPGNIPQNATVAASVWVKVGPGWPDKIMAYLTFRTSNVQLGTTAAYIQPTTHWQKITVYGKNTNIAAKESAIRLTIVPKTGAYATDADFQAAIAGKKLYIDAASIVTGHLVTNWQIGGTPRTNEKITYTTALEKQHAFVLNWFPNSGSLEWSGNLYVGNITDASDNHIDIYWQQSDNQFVATDGTNTAVTTRTNGYRFEKYDLVKIAITNFDDHFRLSVQTPEDVAEHESSSATLLTGASNIVLGADSVGTTYGNGYFANMTQYTSSLTTGEIQNVFDGDIIAPVTTDNIPSSWQNDDTVITLTCNDGSGSGCSKVYYTTDNTDPTESSSYVDAASNWQFTQSIEGIFTLKYRGKDNGGNLEDTKTAANQIRLDSTAPTIPTISTIATNSTTQLTITSTTATDTGSGLADAPYQFQETTGNAGSSSSGWQAGTTFIDSGLTPCTNYRYKVRSKDAAGNISDYSPFVEGMTAGCIAGGNSYTAPTTPTTPPIQPPIVTPPTEQLPTQTPPSTPQTTTMTEQQRTTLITQIKQQLIVLITQLIQLLTQQAGQMR